LKKAAAVSKKTPGDAVAIISYDEKPGIQAIATTAADLPPEPGVHATFARPSYGGLQKIVTLTLIEESAVTWDCW
jgi:hypothetical protein